MEIVLGLWSYFTHCGESSGIVELVQVLQRIESSIVGQCVTFSGKVR